MSIPLQDILPITSPKDYKIHLASWNTLYQPLDVFVRDREEWKEWNTYRSKRDDFNRRYIFSLIDFYPERDIWLFGGVFEVLSRSPEPRAHSYEVQLTPTAKEFIGRLKLHFKRPSRGRAIRLETYYPELRVTELLREPYSGEAFCGYENINHDFSTLEPIFKSDRPDWKAALGSVKGVYLITDKSNGKRYVGSAYGDDGIWARWTCYMETGHGHNDDLTRVIQEKSLAYARKNFRFALLEYRPARTDDHIVLEREAYWKEVLLSRGKFGYNKN